MNIQDAVVFITGANRGLGLAFVQECLRRGARKVYAGVRCPSGSATAGVLEVELDVTDAATIAAAAQRCGDATLLINNAGIVKLNAGSLDPLLTAVSREMFETNFFGAMRISQMFAPVLAGNGGGAMVNILSDAVWLSRPSLAGYSASKAALWSFTNALRSDLRSQNTLVQGLHVSFIDTDMTKSLRIPKTSPQSVVQVALDGVEAGKEEVIADDFTWRLKQSLSDQRAAYLDPPDLLPA
jgi:NAD(P)-dependent dehydrogenase (short-subunit alcohol dehydrogenase family)